MKRFFLVSMFSLTLGMLISLGLGTLLAQPAVSTIGAIPHDLPIEPILIKTTRGNTISAWLILAKSSKGGVLLMHGVRSNRLQMVERARFLYQAGYSSLLFDFQAHGESTGEHITFGYLEQQDASAAFHYLKRRLPQQKIAVLGVSLGGAAALLSDIPQQADALILEAVYSNLETAIANRLEMRLGTIGHYLTPMLSWQIKPRLGFELADLAPIKHIAQIKTPVLIIAGAQDQHTKLAEAEQFYQLAPEPKELWILPQAIHQDFQDYAPQIYQHKLLNFLEQSFKELK